MFSFKELIQEAERTGCTCWTGYKRVPGTKPCESGSCIKESKRGLWDNIHAKQERIKHGSGEKMRKPGSKGAPTDAALKASQNEHVEIEEGLQQTLRKVVPGYAKREIDKKMDAGKFGKTDADKDANFYRYKKIQDRLKKEEVELDEAFINGREYASQGVMHPDHAKMDIHKVSGNHVDFYASKTGDKMQGKVTKNDGKQVHIQAHKELGDGKLHKFKVSSSLPKQNNEEFENGELETSMKSYKDFLTSIDEALWPGTPEYKKKFPETSRGKVGSETKTSHGTNTVTSTGVRHERDYDKAEKETTEQPTGNMAKRGRGRPAGAKSGARKITGTSKLMNK